MDSVQRRGRREIKGGRKGRVKSRKMNKGLVDTVNGVGIDCGREECGRREQQGKSWDNCN